MLKYITYFVSSLIAGADARTAYSNLWQRSPGYEARGIFETGPYILQTLIPS